MFCYCLNIRSLATVHLTPITSHLVGLSVPPGLGVVYYFHPHRNDHNCLLGKARMECTCSLYYTLGSQ